MTEGRRGMRDRLQAAWGFGHRAYDFLVEVFTEFGKDKGPVLAAALAFYAAFSLFPLLLGLISVAAMFVSPQQAQDLVFQYSQALIASQREFLVGTVAGVVEARGTLGLLAVLLLLWSGKNLFIVLEDVLEQVYGMQRLGGIWGTIWAHVRALGFTVATSAAVIGIAGLVWGLRAVLALELTDILMIPRELILKAVDWFELVLPLGVAAIGLLLLYRYLPARRLSWRQAALSAIVATVLWEAVSLLFGWYLQNFARLNAVYGPISGVMGFYLWLNLTSMIVILSAEVGAVACRRQTGTKSVYT